MSELSAKQFSGTFGAMFKSSGHNVTKTAKMSKGLTGLTGDMASFYNLPHQEVFDKLKAGISGEKEPLKALKGSMEDYY